MPRGEAAVLSLCKLDILVGEKHVYAVWSCKCSTFPTKASSPIADTTL